MAVRYRGIKHGHAGENSHNTRRRVFGEGADSGAKKNERQSRDTLSYSSVLFFNMLFKSKQHELILPEFFILFLLINFNTLKKHSLGSITF